MKIVATKCNALELRPGDLFSTVGPDYWNHVADNHSIGERVYIRMETPAANDPAAAITEVYRITIEQL